jgi:hypothetical protein
MEFKHSLGGLLLRASQGCLQGVNQIASGGFGAEESTSIVIQVVGRFHFLEGVELMAACFFETTEIISPSNLLK